jgi:hypothetical protein
VNRSDAPRAAMKSVREPGLAFRCCRVSEVFDPDLYAALLDWLEHHASWSDYGDGLSEHSTVYLRGNETDEPWPHVWAEWLPAAVETLAVAFDTSFRPGTTIWANRFCVGEKISVHNDFSPDPQPGDLRFFTHRLIVYLTRSWSPEDGGMLGIFSDELAVQPLQIVPPLANSGIAMAFGPRSYHGVSRVRSGERYTINLSLVASDRNYQTAPWEVEARQRPGP